MVKRILIVLGIAVLLVFIPYFLYVLSTIVLFGYYSKESLILEWIVGFLLTIIYALVGLSLRALVAYAIDYIKYGT